MYLKLFLVTSVFFTLINGEENLALLVKTHSTPLEKYVNFIDSVILHFEVPLDTSFASFKFEADEIPLSIYGCKHQNITVYLKDGSPPVINPNGAKTPKRFVNYTRPMERIEFKSKSEPAYINITSPSPGSFFAAAFISYTDPKSAGITQKGLVPVCQTIVTASLFIRRLRKPIIVVPDAVNDVRLQQKTSRVYKFYVFDIVNSTTFFIKNIEFCDTCTELTIRVQSNKIPTDKSFLREVHLKRENYEKKSYMFRITTAEESWYYISFFANSTNEGQQSVHFEFIVQYVPSSGNQSLDDSKEKSKTAQGVMYKRSVLRDFQSPYLDLNVEYKQYDLIRKGYTESFLFFYELQSEELDDPVPVNMTDKDLVLLKFHVMPGVDIGGTLRFGIQYKSQSPASGDKATMKTLQNHTVIACLKNRDKQIPMWPNQCLYRGIKTDAALLINETFVNSTLLLPYPEPGNWYASLKLYCGECKPCQCHQRCKEAYQNCYIKCESTCTTIEECTSCIENCENLVLSKKDCKGCDCDGPCQKSTATCNASIIFEISSYPCIMGHCGVNGKCMYMLAEGFSYSVCYCKNNYKGWDCGDGSDANSSAHVILEMCLLVISNFAFLISTRVAYKRKYYVESIVYFSAFFFSSFYHACDSGEHIYTFCIASLSVLQFSDFFSGLLSIWVTIIAMAYLKSPLPSVLHISGAIILAFITTIDKTALWAFALPFVTGVVILIISWCLRSKKLGRRFPSDRYLFRKFPMGVGVAASGLLIYGLLQTNSNYFYLHSIWHVCMAVCIIFLLPDKFFLPPAEDEPSESILTSISLIISRLRAKNKPSPLFTTQPPTPSGDVARIENHERNTN